MDWFGIINAGIMIVGFILFIVWFVFETLFMI